MNFQELISTFGLYLTTFVVCLVSGFVPLIHAESYLVLVSALAPKHAAFPIILIAVIAQMLAKSLLYLAGKGTLKLSTTRYEKKIDKTIQKFHKWRNKTDLFILLSASSGFPPFYLVSIIAGVFKLKFGRFFVCGFVGRLIRFSIVVLFPQIIKGFWR